MLQRRGVLSKGYLLVEFGTLFFIIPGLLAAHVVPNRPILVLAGCAAAVVLSLRRDPEFEFPTLVRGVGAYSAMVIAALLFAGLSAHPRFWITLLLAYPLLSVYPQEIVYRAFLFHRYERLIRPEPAMMLASATAFAFAHIVYRNPIAIGLSFIGGLLFAFTYRRTGSLLLAWMEHAILGVTVFAVGLGSYFEHAR